MARGSPLLLVSVVLAAGVLSSSCGATDTGVRAAPDKTVSKAKPADSSGASSADASAREKAAASASAAEREKKAAALAEELDELNMSAIGSLSSSPSSTSGLKLGSGGGAPIAPGPGGGPGLAGLGKSATSSDPPGNGKVVAPSGEVSVAGAVGASAITDADTVIARNRWRFKACYSKALASDLALKGSATATVTVDANGEVSTAKATGDIGTTVASCVAASFRTLSFSPPTTAPVTFTVKIAFAPKS